MLPVLFRIGPYPVGTHDFFVLLGVGAATAVFVWEAHRRNALSEKLLWVVLGSLFFGALGARAGAVLGDLTASGDPSIGESVLQAGRSILGGLAGAYAGAVLTKRLIGYRRSTGDLFAPAVALGMAVGRWGCFLTEQPGTATSLPWGLRLSEQAAARIPNCPPCVSGAAMHPSFLYEILFQSSMFALLWWGLRRQRRAEGDLFKFYLVAYAVFRFLVEFVRGNEVVLGGLTPSQLFLIPSILLLAAYFSQRFARGAYSSVGPGAAITRVSPAMARTQPLPRSQSGHLPR